jgi:hypothetical protein
LTTSAVALSLNIGRSGGLLERISSCVEKVPSALRRFLEFEGKTSACSLSWREGGYMIYDDVRVKIDIDFCAGQKIVLSTR